MYVEDVLHSTVYDTRICVWDCWVVLSSPTTKVSLFGRTLCRTSFACGTLNDKKKSVITYYYYYRLGAKKFWIGRQSVMRKWAIRYAPYGVPIIVWSANIVSLSHIARDSTRESHATGDQCTFTVSYFNWAIRSSEPNWLHSRSTRTETRGQIDPICVENRSFSTNAWLGWARARVCTQVEYRCAQSFNFPTHRVASFSVFAGEIENESLQMASWYECVLRWWVCTIVVW